MAIPTEFLLRLDFLKNSMGIPAMDVALTYKSRWNIEAFFKWMKQHLRIKEFYGTSENAVKIQIYCAITAYCLVALAERRLRGWICQLIRS